MYRSPCRRIVDRVGEARAQLADSVVMADRPTMIDDDRSYRAFHLCKSFLRVLHPPVTQAVGKVDTDPCLIQLRDTIRTTFPESRTACGAFVPHPAPHETGQ